MKKTITLVLFLIISLFIFNKEIEAKESKNLVNIYFFHSNTCAHCKEETKYLNYLEKRYKNIKIYKYEIHNKDNYELLKQLEVIYDIKINSVPLTIIGNEVYTGYSEKSKIKFIKTIEYFSQYSYEDKLGKYLEVDIPDYNIKKQDISLNNFINSYHNYNLLGLKTDNLDTSSIAIILGMISCFNIISIIGSILVIIIVSIIKIKKESIKLLTLTLYTVLISILLLISLLNNFILNLIIFILITIIFIYSIVNTIKRNKKYLIINLIILISITQVLLTTFFNNKHILIFKRLLELHGLTGISKILYFANYLVMNLIITFLIIYLEYLIIKKIKNSICS